ncbi:GNAT family N-acetyltransferase [soil metagenome]
MTTFTIDEVALPQSLDEPGAPDYIRTVEVGNTVEEIGFGTDELAHEPAEDLPYYIDPHQPTRMLVARVDGDIVARGMYETTLGDEADTAWLTVQVLPEFRGRGIGTAPATATERLASADGKAKAVVYTTIPEVQGERIPSPTGFGSVPADHPDARFLLSRGYRLEQIERLSRLALPVGGLDALVAAARERSGPDYAVHSWVGRTPERWLEGIALLNTRMSTDAPTAGLEEPEDVWTAERLVESDDLVARLSPRQKFTTAVEYLPTGTLAGYTDLSVPRQLHRAVAQGATLVLREHRGHALGMLLKVANLAHLERERPGHPSITTFNAEENRYMLDVNEAVGFVPIAHASAWRKDLGQVGPIA